VEHNSDMKIRRRAWRDRPLAPCDLTSPDEFALEERREKLRDLRWKRRRDQLVLLLKLMGSSGGVAIAAHALSHTLPF
jgi:hypothetical protein